VPADADAAIALTANTKVAKITIQRAVIALPLLCDPPPIMGHWCPASA
jgi:hypothetical protein